MFIDSIFPLCPFYINEDNGGPNRLNDITKVVQLLSSRVKTRS